MVGTSHEKYDDDSQNFTIISAWGVLPGYITTMSLCFLQMYVYTFTYTVARHLNFPNLNDFITGLRLNII